MDMRIDRGGEQLGERTMKMKRSKSREYTVVGFNKYRRNSTVLYLVLKNPSMG